MPEAASFPASPSTAGVHGVRVEASKPVVAVRAVRECLLPVTLLALVLRLFVALVIAKTSTPQWLFSQATELGCMASSFNQGLGLSSPFCGHTGPSAFLAPGYPLLLACVFRVFGAFTMRSAACVVFLQAIFSTALIPVVMYIARRVSSGKAAILAGVLCALNPWLIGMEAVLWETSLSILLMTALLGLAIALQQQPSRSISYTAAAVLAIATLVNPSLLLSGAALLWAAYLLRSKPDTATPPRVLLLGPVLLFCSVCSPWVVRNRHVLHAFVPLRSNMGYELWQGNHPGSDGFFQARLHPNVNVAEYKHYQDLGEIAYMGEKSRLAHAWIAEHPWRFAALSFKRAVCFWTGAGRTPSILVIGSTVLLSLSGWAGLLSLARDNRKLAALFAVPLFLLPLPYYISHPDFRFWCLLAPALTVLTARGLMTLRSIRRLAGES